VSLYKFMNREAEMREELKWFVSFPNKLKKFEGKHVALLGNKVIASGESAKGVLEESKKKYPQKTPVLTFIPKKGLLIL